MWAAEAEADVRMTIDTARLRGANPFDIIVSVLAQPRRGLQNPSPIAWGLVITRKQRITSAAAMETMACQAIKLGILSVVLAAPGLVQPSKWTARPRGDFCQPLHHENVM